MINENRVIPMIINFLADGEKARNLVTNKIKNYPSAMRMEAIKYVISEGLVVLEERASEVGRNPVYIKLTEKGQQLARDISGKSLDKTIWGL